MHADQSNVVCSIFSMILHGVGEKARYFPWATHSCLESVEQHWQHLSSECNATFMYSWQVFNICRWSVSITKDRYLIDIGKEGRAPRMSVAQNSPHSQLFHNMWGKRQRIYNTEPISPKNEQQGCSRIFFRYYRIYQGILLKHSPWWCSYISTLSMMIFDKTLCWKWLACKLNSCIKPL